MCYASIYYTSGFICDSMCHVSVISATNILYVNYMFLYLSILQFS